MDTGGSDGKVSLSEYVRDPNDLAGAHPVEGLVAKS
jgi:hypothetical protein